MKIDNRTFEKIEYFNALGSHWDEHVGNNAERLSEIKRVFDDIALVEGGSVLDVGCGNGVLFKLILEKIGPRGFLTAVDSSPVMLERAKRLHAGMNNINYVSGIVERIDTFNAVFDTIVCFSVFPHIDDKMGALVNFRKIIRISGRLYIFHLSDTRSLNSFHHGLKSPVHMDVMPFYDELVGMASESGFAVVTYVDRPGLNFVEMVPC
jgi:demethylmenaquinone methyltransferase/2-methoxy-6-polyprenyl-1,4-benzoquinol methylase